MSRVGGSVWRGIRSLHLHSSNRPSSFRNVLSDAGVGACRGAPSTSLARAGRLTNERVLSTTMNSNAKVDDALQDEYGDMDSSGLTYECPGEFVLENGSKLMRPQVRYNTWGTLNEAKDNVLVICHALTGNARIDSWWGTMLGPGKAFDTDKYLIFAANILGSCYGSTGPRSIDPLTGSEYGSSFPAVSVRDTVRIHIQALREAIGPKSVACVVGGSFGGMQTLEWGYMGREGNFVRSIAPYCCGVAHSAWQIAISESQRQAIYADPNWKGGNFSLDAQPLAGLSVARQFAMITYRTRAAFQAKFGREIKPHGQDVLENQPSWQARSYLEHQGSKFLTRFDALTYVHLTQQMDTHDVGRGRGGAAAALARVTQPALVVAIDSDILYPVEEQKEVATMLSGSEFHVIESNEGHDGFLLEQDAITDLLKRFLSSRVPETLCPANNLALDESGSSPRRATPLAASKL